MISGGTFLYLTVERDIAPLCPTWKQLKILSMSFAAIGFEMQQSKVAATRIAHSTDYFLIFIIAWMARIQDNQFLIGPFELHNGEQLAISAGQKLGCVPRQCRYPLSRSFSIMCSAHTLRVLTPRSACICPSRRPSLQICLFAFIPFPFPFPATFL